MSFKSSNQLGFADLSASKRKCKHTFFDQLNHLLDWVQVEKLLKKYYSKGFHVLGKPAYSPLLLFKMLLLQTWYGLSDYQVEEEVNDRLTFSKFCGLSMDNSVPDHSVLSRFRTELTKNKGLDSLLNMVNSQLSMHGFTLHRGSGAVDASLTPTPRKPKGKKSYDLQAGTLSVSKSYQKGVDQEASWAKKGSNLCYGYKRHIAVDIDQGLVLGVITTKASEADTTTLGRVLEKIKLAPGSRVYADKGYAGNPNEQLLKTKGLRTAIQRKSTKNKTLSHREKQLNHIISKTRYKVERVFGSIKSWFRSYGARYIGMAKMHTQHVLEAIAYNLYRAPNSILRGI